MHKLYDERKKEIMEKAKKELHIIDYNGVMVADSREIAEVLERSHYNVKRAVKAIAKSGMRTSEEMEKMFKNKMVGRASCIYMTKEGCRLLIDYRNENKNTDREKNTALLSAFRKAFLNRTTAATEKTEAEKAENKQEISIKNEENTEAKNVTEIAIPDRYIVPEADIDVTENMNVPELLHVDYSGERPVVSGRELHEALKVKTEYAKWLERMCEYGFTEGKDFSSILTKSTGGRPSTDHALTIPMAKELCMLQRTEKGKFFRQYFIRIEEMWNSPAFVMKRALEFANRQVSLLKIEVNRLEETVTEQNQQIEKQNEQIAELSPKAEYCDKVLRTSELVTITDIAKDFGKSAVWLNKKLHEKKVQFKQGGIWHLYQGYAEKGYAVTRTTIVEDRNGKEHSMTHTYWTQKGRKFIFDLLAEENIFPVTMQEQIIMMPLLEQEEVTV